MLTFFPASMGQFCRRKVPYLNKIGMGVGPVGDYLATYWQHIGDSMATCIAAHNVMSCPALHVRKLVFGFNKRVKASQHCIVQAICGSDIDGGFQLEQTGINCYTIMSTMLARVGPI